MVVVTQGAEGSSTTSTGHLRVLLGSLLGALLGALVGAALLLGLAPGLLAEAEGVQAAAVYELMAMAAGSVIGVAVALKGHPGALATPSPSRPRTSPRSRSPTWSSR